ncbi:MAG TPA: ABC transporter ATP-binding protein [Candidatus Saccharimonadales bacterium]
MRSDNARTTLAYYWRHARRYPRTVAGVLISVPLTVLVNQFLPPLIVARVLNRLSRGDFQPHHLWASFGGDLIAYALLQFLGSVVMWRVVDYFDWKLEGHVEKAMAREIFDHMLKQSANFHADRFSGSLVSQTSKLMGSYVRFADTTIFMVLPLLSSLILVVLILANRAALFVALLVAFSICYMVAAFFITGPTRRAAARQAAAESEQTGFLADAITNVMAIKSFSGSTFEAKRFARATDKTHKMLGEMFNAHARQQVYFSSMTSSLSTLALVMAVVGVVVFNTNFAVVYLILSYTSGIVSQLFTFSNSALRNYNRALGDAKDMVEVLAIQPEIKDPAAPLPARITDGTIKFNDVVFTHGGAGDALFNGLTLTIKAGEKIGLVGPSGSGKSTLTRILLRFSDLDSGEILIDDQNIAQLAQDDLRRHIAYVPQEPLLFHRTIAENIAYGKTDASDKEIREAARKANADQFIAQLSNGYETLVGERGVKLSGGQRQRVAIARAILKDAPILVLDEATSALDSESEVLIQAALQELMKKRTAIVIAHRLSTIQKMDRILVLDHGEIVEQGTHKELLKHNGVYAKLWAHQSGGFIED